MTSKGALIKSYEQIFNLRIRNFKRYFPIGNWLIIDGKSEIIDVKWVSAPKKCREVFH